MKCKLNAMKSAYFFILLSKLILLGNSLRNKKILRAEENEVIFEGLFIHLKFRVTEREGKNRDRETLVDLLPR